jgi:hypothetical protein
MDEIAVRYGQTRRFAGARRQLGERRASQPGERPGRHDARREGRKAATQPVSRVARDLLDDTLACK